MRLFYLQVNDCDKSFYKMISDLFVDYNVFVFSNNIDAKNIVERRQLIVATICSYNEEEVEDNNRV